MKTRYIILLLFIFMGSSISYADDKSKTKPIAAKVSDEKADNGEDKALKRAVEENEKRSIEFDGDSKELSIGDVGEAKQEGLNWWQLLLKHLLELVFTILGIMGTALVTVLFQKYKFQSHTEKINEILKKALGLAEQKSIKALKLTGEPIDSVKKLELAINFAKDLAAQLRLPDRGGDWWEEMLESKLGERKIEKVN